ncbi:hypothetical protein Lal_00012589 [Lupinus albus]|uniref:Putative legumain protein n=1 Tax=Lupinus albus TaxID=3870 RepID=A0A6A5NL41_LUPAL|nr:putative legumain protein [Lupinus albus]KAF1883672.1 hypothetical protein Lal_00012589 [Lupinus albus]
MNHFIIYCVALVASLWLSSTVTMLEGISPIDEAESGKRWAILVAGSRGYENYRHQADVCHAYQILKKGGLKDENIIVFMYDDIASHPANPRPGVIINKPNGTNVYEGVPKDYTGDDVNVNNFYGVISGNRSAIHGGSGKVLNSGPNDSVFIYYSDHGAAGIVEMPNEPMVMANEFMDVLKKKHAANGYKKLVIYFEACEAGSMFEGLLPNNINIYVTTASNATESSFAAYCPQFIANELPEETTCLGDLYSVSWMEDSDKNDRTKETVKQQYEKVRQRTLSGDGDIETSSHVLEFGDRKISNDVLSTYIGAGPTNVIDNSNLTTPLAQTTIVDQRDARLLYLRLKLAKARDGSNEKLQVQKELAEEIAHREHVDKSVDLLVKHLFEKEKSYTIINNVRPKGQSLVDDWDCYTKMMKTYESHCGALSSYGRKYSRAFANICNAGISEKQIVAAASQICPRKTTMP